MPLPRRSKFSWFNFWWRKTIKFSNPKLEHIFAGWFFLKKWPPTSGCRICLPPHTGVYHHPLVATERFTSLPSFDRGWVAWQAQPLRKPRSLKKFTSWRPLPWPQSGSEFLNRLGWWFLKKKRGCPNFLGGYWNSRSVRRFLAKFGCQWTKNTWSIIFVGGSSQWVSRRIEGCFGGVSLSARKTLTILRTRFYGWYSFWARKSHPKCPGLQFVWFFSSHLPAALYCPLSSQPNCQMKWAAQVLSNQNNHKQIRDHSITFFFGGGSNKQHIYGHFEGFPAKHVHCLGWCHIKKSGESCKRSHIVPSTSSENISSQTAFFVTHQQNCRSQIKFAWNFFRDKQNPQKQRVFF